jgi:hypothetical protein
MDSSTRFSASVFFVNQPHMNCSKTTLTGESRFHISTPLGIDPGSLMMGSKQVDHWTSGTVCEYSEIAGSPQGSPTAANYVSCEARRRTCSERMSELRQQLESFTSRNFLHIFGHGVA